MNASKPPPTRARRFFGSHALVDLVVVILGITISFALQDWREARADRKEEARLVSTLRANLRADHAMLEKLVAHNDTAIERLEGLLEDEPPAEFDVDVAMDIAISYISFRSTNVAWQQLQAAASARLIRDRSLLDRIVALYTTTYQLSEEWDEINRRFIINRMIPYIDEFGPFAEGEIVNGIATGMGAVHRKLIAFDRFKNLLRTNRLFRGGQRAAYTILRDAIQQQLDALDVAD